MTSFFLSLLPTSFQSSVFYVILRQSGSQGNRRRQSCHSLCNHCDTYNYLDVISSQDFPLTDFIVPYRPSQWLLAQSNSLAQSPPQNTTLRVA